MDEDGTDGFLAEELTKGFFGAVFLGSFTFLHSLGPPKIGDICTKKQKHNRDKGLKAQSVWDNRLGK